MNKRIKELADLAGFIRFSPEEDPQTPIDWSCEYDIELEKFAELIIRECAQTLIDNTPVLDEYDAEEDWDKGYDRAMKDCVHHIKEHFGVEE